MTPSLPRRLRVAWFCPVPSATVEAEASSALIHALRARLDVDVLDAANAHDFVVEHARGRYDVSVFAPRNRPASDFIWGYLFNYPGVLFLQDASLHDSRVRELERYRRESDYQREFSFSHGHPTRGRVRPFARGGWPMLRAPLLSSTLVVVTDAEHGGTLVEAGAGSRVRVVPAHATGPERAAAMNPASSGPLRVAVASTFHREETLRAVERIRSLGIPAIAIDSPPHAIEPSADVIVAFDSPAEVANLTLPLSAMASGKCVIVFEREATAIWPALDPQTWRTRPSTQRDAAPVVVSVDLRDEAHSLTLALTHLAHDADGRAALGSAARAWWLEHATPAHAAAAWHRVLEEAATLRPPARPADWPQHLEGDGMAAAGRTLGELGIDANPWA